MPSSHWREFSTPEPEAHLSRENIRQFAKDGKGRIAVARVDGLFEGQDMQKVIVRDELGRQWATHDVRGVTYDSRGQLWFATRAGVGCRTEKGWIFFEGKDGLPYNDFTCCAAGGDGSVWFGTRRGAIRFADGVWSYRQGKRWLPHDDVRDIAVDRQGNAWFATADGVGYIERKPMTLAEKAELYEADIEKYIKRTELGYVAEVSVPIAGVREAPRHHDSDNDGLWTSMYGAGECFAYGATKSKVAKRRADQAFRALSFLQQVTQGGHNAAPAGYIARTILPTTGRNPNDGRLESDKAMRANRDRLWKVYEPRWPKSADGKWYWKSDTSSDELDGHYFFYGLYYDLVAETAAEKEAVRNVVARLTDHLIDHNFTLTDHDGKPTRWANFNPTSLNHDFNWFAERGLNSLSMLSYLSVAHHLTGDKKYSNVFNKLMREHSYHTNAWMPKMQRGIGSGNQSDDEMAFMSFYNLMKYMPNKESEQELWSRFLSAFYWYWTLEQPEQNPFFNFCYAAFGQGKSVRDPFDDTDLSPWNGWLEDSVNTLTGFPIDRFDWSHQNSHRLDIIRLPKQNGRGSLDNNDGSRGLRVDGKVIPVTERFFAHWNTDPWRLDTGGNGHTLASGTVFLLPYYMGLYHGFIE